MDTQTSQKLTELESKMNGLENLIQSRLARISIPLNSAEKTAVNSMIQYPVSANLEGTSAATAANYGIFFTANKTLRVIEVTEIHTTLGTDAGAVTLQLEKLTGTTALDSGTTLLSTAFNLKGTINTVQYGTLVLTGDVILARGDRLALKDAGTLTAVAGMSLTVWLEQI